MYGYVRKDHCSLDLSAAEGGREDGRREQKKGERMEELKDKEKGGDILNQDIKGQNARQVQTLQLGGRHSF